MDDVRWAISQEIPYLRRFAYGLVGDVERADEFVQASLEISLRRHRLWLRRGSVRLWLFRILFRLVRDAKRRGRDRPPLEVEADTCDADGNDALAGLDRLPPEERAALILLVVEGLAYEEAAAVLGVSVGTIRERLSRARDTLRRWSTPAEPPAAGTSLRLRRVK
jgi:RNA polymerase sigma-70 factor (ECF subfamily)